MQLLFRDPARDARQVPVFVTESGTQQASGDGRSDDFRSGAVFKSGTCSGGSFSGTGVLKPAGVRVRDRVRTPDAFPTS